MLGSASNGDAVRGMMERQVNQMVQLVNDGEARRSGGYRDDREELLTAQFRDGATGPELAGGEVGIPNA